jgi:hypothetical protein
MVRIALPFCLQIGKAISVLMLLTSFFDRQIIPRSQPLQTYFYTLLV